MVSGWPSSVVIAFSLSLLARLRISHLCHWSRTEAPRSIHPWSSMHISSYLHLSSKHMKTTYNGDSDAGLQDSRIIKAPYGPMIINLDQLLKPLTEVYFQVTWTRSWGTRNFGPKPSLDHPEFEALGLGTCGREEQIGRMYRETTPEMAFNSIIITYTNVFFIFKYYI